MEEIKVKYFVDDIDELCYVDGKSDWIDLRAAEHIQTGAFRGCLQLTELTIPASVHTIGAEAFAACESLTSVYFEGDPQTLGNNIFPVHEQAGAALTIYGCAGGSVEAYAKAAGIPFEVWHAA